MSTDWDTIRAAAIARLEEVLASPKPSYTVNGQTVNWTEYTRMLQQQIDWIDTKVQQDEPFEIHSQGYT